MSLVNLENVEAKSDYEPLPEGIYNLSIEEAHVQDTKAGTGQYIRVVFLVQDEKFKDRKVFHNFNIKNPSEKAVEIGLSQLKSMLLSAGKSDPNLEKVEDLYGLTCQAKIRIKQDETYGARNEISYFKIDRQGPEDSNTEDIPF